MSMASDLDSLKDLLNFGYGDSLQRKVYLLPEDEYHSLRNSLPIMISRLQDVKEEIDELERDRTTDYERYILRARKYFNDTDIGILEILQGLEESSALRYDYIREQLPEHPSGNLLRKRMHRLWRMGLVKYARGLFDEEGQAAGSGFMLNQRRAGITERIVESYHAANKQESLL